MPKPASRYLVLFSSALLSAAFGYAQSRPGSPGNSAKQCVIDGHGAIIRGDVAKKQLALVFTGDEFADGGDHVLTSLRRNKIKSSFFLTGHFYRKSEYKHLIRKLKKDGHYLGAHSDKHLLYADWSKRDSLLVTRDEFRKDLLQNYEQMKHFGIKPSDAPYFLPPYEWYNSVIAEWTRELGFQLINFSPGTRSAADYTYPEMGERYLSSDAIYRSIMEKEEADPVGLNGFILLIHIGADPRRKDKFYDRLDEMVSELQSRGYRFVSITELLDGESID